MEYGQLIERNKKRLFWFRKRKRGRNMWNRCGNTTVNTRSAVGSVTFMLSCAETWISYNSVDVIRPKRSRKYKVTLRKHVFLLFPLKWSDRMLTEILGYRLQIFLLFLLTYSDLEGTETLGFVPETLFFLFLLYIGLFQHSLFLIFLFITGRVNMLWSCGFIQPIPDFYRPLAKSMLHPVKSHK